MPDTSPASTKKAIVRRSATGKKEQATTDPLSVQTVVAPKKRVARKAGTVAAISPEERHHLIAVAAFFIAERNTFPGASPHDDWLQAETEIDAMIAEGKFTS